MLGNLWLCSNVRSPGGWEWLIVSHCFVNDSTSLSALGSETKNTIISILCYFKSKRLAYTVWRKKRNRFSQRAQFSKLLAKYLPFCYINSHYPSWQGHRKKRPLHFAFSTSPCWHSTKFKSVLSILSTNGHFLLVMWNFLDQCLSNLNMHTNQLWLPKLHICSAMRLLVSPGVLCS